MKSSPFVLGVLLAVPAWFLSSCAVREEKVAAPAKAAPAPVVEAKAKPAEKTEAKAKPVKALGDVGLLDLEKNYMILVTKEGKLITVDFDPNAKVTKIVPTPAKMEDIGLGSSATVEYASKGEKKYATKIEFRAKKGGE
jgi:hypothetical protein